MPYFHSQFYFYHSFVYLQTLLVFIFIYPHPLKAAVSQPKARNYIYILVRERFIVVFIIYNPGRSSSIFSK